MGRSQFLHNYQLSKGTKGFRRALTVEWGSPATQALAMWHHNVACTQTSINLNLRTCEREMVDYCEAKNVTLPEKPFTSHEPHNTNLWLDEWLQRMPQTGGDRLDCGAAQLLPLDRRQGPGFDPQLCDSWPGPRPGGSPLSRLPLLTCTSGPNSRNPQVTCRSQIPRF